MASLQQIGSFLIGGARWKIKLDTKPPNEQRYYIDYPMQTVVIANGSGSLLFNHQFMMKNLWEAIIVTIANKEMYYSKVFKRNSYIPYSAMWYQIMETLRMDEEWEGTYTVGAIEYRILIDTEDCLENMMNGAFYYYEKKIVLCRTNSKGLLIPDDFLRQTLYHELLHCIARELGLEDTPINSEKFVNTLSLFLHEAEQSLTIKFPE